MIKTDVISASALKMVASEKLTVEDFRQLRPQIDSLISQHGKIRLLIDASGFGGWENLAAPQLTRGSQEAAIRRSSASQSSPHTPGSIG